VVVVVVADGSVDDGINDVGDTADTDDGNDDDNLSPSQ
jgi:hypothetical protein